MGKMKFRLAARCEAAGRPNNEDNYHVYADLSAGKWQFTKDEVLPLGEKGALLLVCDGMGGMNAGEVASMIAVETVKRRFSKDGLAKEVLEDDERRCDFIRRVIQEADANIKKESRADAAKSGMGSTIVLAWLIDEKVYVGWCGDSRAYKYNPQRGFSQLSHDHSYVQELVDSGKLSPELAFDHPNSNIITRSLGDPRGVAQPDVKCFPLEENDVILLCSDGLCGLLRDQEMEHVLASNLNSMASCIDALWEAACAAGWHDNVTIALAQIMPQQVGGGADKPVEAKPSNAIPAPQKPNKKTKVWNNKYLKICSAAMAVLLLAIVLVVVLSEPKDSEGSEPDTCSRYNEIVKDYTGIKQLGEKDAVIKIDDVLNNLDSIKGCDDLIRSVLDVTSRHKKSFSEMKGMEGMDEIGEKLDRIENLLKD